MQDALEIVTSIKDELVTLARIDARNGLTFKVRGWPFAILRNGHDMWDLLSPSGLDESLTLEALIEAIREQVIDAEADNAGWDFDPQEIAI